MTEAEVVAILGPGSAIDESGEFGAFTTWDRQHLTEANPGAYFRQWTGPTVGIFAGFDATGKCLRTVARAHGEESQFRRAARQLRVRLPF